MKDDGRPALTHGQAVEIALSGPAPQTPLAARRRRLYAESAAGVLADVAAAGFPGLEEVGELRRRGQDYKAAVPVLLEWLPRVRYLLLAEDIVRTLSVGFAKKLALPEFLRLFRRPPEVADPIRPETSEPAEEHLRWVIGNGLGIFAGPAVADDLIELALDRGYGQARTEIVRALPKTKDERVPQVLLGLLDDPAVSAFAVEALGKLKFTEAREPIARLLGHSDKNVRDQAEKALKRIDG
ncbi:MAG: HEAT repeat domain-containing protein [Actinomadura sp.]